MRGVTIDSGARHVLKPVETGVVARAFQSSGRIVASAMGVNRTMERWRQMVRPPRPGMIAVAVVGATLGLVLASCSVPGTTGGPAVHNSSGAQPVSVGPPHVTVSPSDQSQGVALDVPVVVT